MVIVKLQIISSKKQLVQVICIQPTCILFPEAALQRCSKERFSGNMVQIYRRIPMLKRDFNRVALQLTEIALRHECSPVNLLHIFRTPFYKIKYGGLLLYFQPTYHCFSFKAPSENKQLSGQLKTCEEIHFLSTITLKTNLF